MAIWVPARMPESVYSHGSHVMKCMWLRRIHESPCTRMLPQRSRKVPWTHGRRSAGSLIG
eukprot:1879697-Alexandrium_andersonii.AAC.1